MGSRQTRKFEHWDISKTESGILKFSYAFEDQITESALNEILNEVKSNRN